MRVCGLARMGLACACAGALLSVPVAPASAAAKPFVPGELLVRFEPQTGAAAVRSSLAGEGAAVAERLPAVPGLRLVDLPAGTSVAGAVRSYESLPGVLYAEPNYERGLLRLSRDRLFAEQWAQHNTGQRVFGVQGIAGADEGAAAAWDLQRGNASVTVAVVDTGMALGHPDLDGNLWVNPGEVPGNGLDDDANGFPDDVHGWDFLDGDGTPDDSGDNEQGHGTHVAGIIGAEGENGIGIAGVNWDVSLMALRAYGSVAEEIAAFAYARDNGARVVNYSAGSSLPSQAERDVIAASPEVLFVAAAGNDRSNNDAGPIYPCAYELVNVVCVGSSGQGDRLSSFSNFGPTSVDLVAPGENVLSTWPSGAIADVLRERLRPAALRKWKRNGRGRSLLSPPVDLGAWRSCVLEFKIDGKARSRDGRLSVEISRDRRHFRRVARPKARRRGTQITELPRRFGNDRSAYVRFGLPRGSTVRNVALSCEATRDTWAYEDGTSSSAPQVSGAAGLVLAQHPLYNVAQLRQALLGSVEVMPALYGKVVTSGRLDAGAAVTP